MDPVLFLNVNILGLCNNPNELICLIIKVAKATFITKDLDEFQSRLFDKLSIREQEIITELLRNYYDDDQFTDKKREEIKFIIYNNSD